MTQLDGYLCDTNGYVSIGSLSTIDSHQAVDSWTVSLKIALDVTLWLGEQLKHRVPAK